MALTAEQRQVLVTRLGEAETAFHELQLGIQARVFVDQNGERVEYTAARRNELATYIFGLKSQLGLITRTGMAPMSVGML